jgi:hypothetical protein
MRGWKWASVLVIGVSASACSLALDLDALQAGTPVDAGPAPCTGAADCDDGVDCTGDLCQADGSCANVPDNSLCAEFEVCDTELGCVPTGAECDGPSDCDDGASCTEDSCVEGQCVNDADDAACENPNPCIESEACEPADPDADPETGCLAGNEMFCDQSEEPCMQTACNPATGVCEDFLMEDADNDVDTYLDAECDGDDCDDEDDAIHPGAAESCNGVDDDCDGLTDAVAIVGPTEIDAADDIGPAAVAARGGLAAIVWQRGEDPDGAVLAAVIGSDGAPIAEAVDLTAAGGAGATGAEPDVAAGAAGSFWVVWVAANDAESVPFAAVAELTADEVGGTIAAGSPVVLETATATDVWAPRIAWDDDATAAGSGWVASFAAAYGDATRRVQLQTEDMHSSPAGSAFDVDIDAGDIDRLSLAVLAPNSYAVAYSRDDDLSGGDREVFASEIELQADAWANAAGFPARISAYDATADDDSYWPSITATADAGAWVAAFVDADPADPTPYDDIVLYDGAAAELAGDGVSDYLEPSLAFDGDASYGLLYLANAGTSSFAALTFRWLDAEFAAPSPPYAGTRLASSSDTGDDTGGGRLAAVGPGRFAAVWVSRIDSSDHLEFVDFEVCDPDA